MRSLTIDTTQHVGNFGGIFCCHSSATNLLRCNNISVTKMLENNISIHLELCV